MRETIRLADASPLIDDDDNDDDISLHTEDDVKFSRPHLDYEYTKTEKLQP